MDPTDTFIIGLHNVLDMPSSSLTRNNNNQHVTLDFFHLKKMAVWSLHHSMMEHIIEDHRIVSTAPI